MRMASVLKCFAPSKPSSTDGLAAEMFSSLASDLQQLQKSLEENPPSLRWCSEAMLVVKKTHSHFLLYFEGSKESESWEGGSMLEEYMSASLELLDLCNLLKSAVTSLNRHRMKVDFMIKTVNDASFTTMASKIDLERNEIEKSYNLFKFRKWRELNLNEGDFSKVKLKARTKVHILQPIRSTMSIVSLFIFCSILHPIPIKINEEFYKGFQDFDSFSESVRKLVFTFVDKLQNTKGKRTLILHENEMIEDAVAAFTAEFVSAKAGEAEGELQQRLDALKNRSLALKQGIDLFESVVNGLFEDVIKGRKKVMCLITTNNHSLYNS